MIILIVSDHREVVIQPYVAYNEHTPTQDGLLREI